MPHQDLKDAAAVVAGVRDSLIVAANNPASHGGIDGLRSIMRAQAERLAALSASPAAVEAVYVEPMVMAQLRANGDFVSGAELFTAPCGRATTALYLRPPVAHASDGGEAVRQAWNAADVQRRALTAALGSLPAAEGDVAVLHQRVQNLEAFLARIFAAQRVSPAGEYLGWKIAGAGSLNEVVEEARLYLDCPLMACGFSAQQQDQEAKSLAAATPDKGEPQQ